VVNSRYNYKLHPNPQPGQAIADTTRNFFVDWIWEIQQVDGTPKRP
jgi:hypothetical protein